ncbi:hypothetical protein DRN79_04500 [Methanosarcinales archaeon]|nr:MAG: hypothetical protein DRN79_04500 [Methanosarcinales archaeon]
MKMIDGIEAVYWHSQQMLNPSSDAVTISFALRSFALRCSMQLFILQFLSTCESMARGWLEGRI